MEGKSNKTNKERGNELYELMRTNSPELLWILHPARAALIALQEEVMGIDDYKPVCAGLEMQIHKAIKLVDEFMEHF